MTTTTDAVRRTSTTPRDRWDRNRIRAVLHWAATLVVVVELASGAAWNLAPIDWTTAQLNHLGYPSYLAVVLGVWQAAAAVALAVPRWTLLKEWAYAGCFFLWSGALWSHLIVGDGPGLWGTPLTFGVLAVLSWVLRPSGRRLPATLLDRDRDDTGAGDASARAGSGSTGVGDRRGWGVAAGVLVIAFGFAFLSLPAIEPVMHERAVEHGWIEP